MQVQYSHLQKTLHSNFSSESTAADVLFGIDLRGKHVVITGGHSGLGLETTRALANAGASVTIGARNVKEAQTATQGINNLSIEVLNLADLESVYEFAQLILAKAKHVDILINNAGVMACPEIRVGNDWESQFAINHLGHFALTNQIWPLLRGGARVITLSSAGHQFSKIRWNDIDFKQEYEKWLAYGQAKTANALFSVHLDVLAKQENVRAFSVHPGSIATPLQRHLSDEEMLALGWIDEDRNPLVPLKTTQQGAATTVWAATNPILNELGGLYCENCEVASVDESNDITLVGVKPHAIDIVQAERLWALSAQLTGCNAFN